MKVDEKFIEGIKKALRENSDYKKLDEKRISLYKQFRFAESANIQKKMKEIEQRAIDAYKKEFEGELKLVSELVQDMSQEDRDNMNYYGNMLIMMCDVIETTIVEMNQLLKKYHPSYSITTFDKVNELAQEAHARVSMLSVYNEDEFYTNHYGDTADKLFKLCYNQVKSFISKIKKHEETFNRKVGGATKVA